MSELTHCPAPTLNVGEKLYGFHVLRVKQLPDIRITAYEAEHQKTAAKVLHLHCDDKENLFSIGFRTPPPDSTGVAHILEHSVLAGSKKFPVKDAFNELAKSTLQTFINAFTFPDKTIYPVASQVRADFFNLARVYTDLVLNPLLAKETFYQEGHHLEFNNEGELKISGIVYNEMKGAYSSPDTLFYKAIQHNLYPDTHYAFDSGGDPMVIPSLTYDRFKEFHRTCYSPTNARFFLYGNILAQDHLAFLEEMLSDFEYIKVNSHIETQKRWEKPVIKRGFYPVGKDEDLKGKTTVNIAWMMMENTDYENTLLLQIVSRALIGTAAGPLRKALIDSGLGEDITPVTGLERDLKQVAFAAGLRGTDPDCAQQIEDITLETLHKVVQTGFDKVMIEGAIHDVEFRRKEIVRGHMPYGIILMRRAYRTWLYDGDPLEGLKFSEVIGKIRESWEKEPDIFQKFVQRWFLDNPHRLLSIMEPSNTYAEKQESSFQEKLERLKASLSREEMENIRKESLSLKSIQAEPDSPSAMATLPKLRLSDIPRSMETIPTEKVEIGGIPTLKHEIWANGITYLDFAFDVSDIPEELQPYLPLLGKLAIGMGAAGLSYEEMAKRIALRTGGLWCNLSAGMTMDGKNNWQKMIFRTKALHRNVPDAINIVSDILTEGDLLDEERMLDLVLEAKNNLYSSVIPSAHLFARMTAAASLSIAAYRNEEWHGRSQLRFLKNISERFHDRKEDIREKLDHLRTVIFRKKRLILNMTADSDGIDLLAGSSERLAGRLADGGSVGVPSPPELSPKHCGVVIPAEVCYVARALEAPTYPDPLSPSLMVLARQLSSNYLYKHIRVQGGAYGAMGQYDPACGIFSFLSYRDPNLVETIKAYDNAVYLMSRKEIGEEELEKAIISTIGSFDRPMDPASKGYAALIRCFSGLAEEDRQRYRSSIFDVSTKSLMEAAGRFLSPVATSPIAVYASVDRLTEANEILDRKLEIESLT